MKRCKQCGTFYSESNAVCPKCGIELPDADDSVDLDNRLYILSIFFNSVVHLNWNCKQRYVPELSGCII